MKNVLLISEETIKKYSLVSDNLDGKYLYSAIQTAQLVDLDILIGTALLNKLQDLVQTNQIKDEANKHYKELLDEYITNYLVYQVMSTVQIAVNYKMSNSGVYSNEGDKKSNLEYKQAQLLQQQYANYANSFANKLKNYLCANVSWFPEYRKCVNYQVAEDAPLCNIYLGDIPFNSHSYIGK